MKMHRYYKVVDGEMKSCRLGKRRAREHGWSATEQEALFGAPKPARAKVLHGTNPRLEVDGVVVDEPFKQVNVPDVMTADRLYDENNLPQLQQLARDYQVPGRSKMTKRQLADAVYEEMKDDGP